MGVNIEISREGLNLFLNFYSKRVSKREK